MVTGVGGVDGADLRGDKDSQTFGENSSVNVLDGNLVRIPQAKEELADGNSGGI